MAYGGCYHFRSALATVWRDSLLTQADLRDDLREAIPGTSCDPATLKQFRQCYGSDILELRQKSRAGEDGDTQALPHTEMEPSACRFAEHHLKIGEATIVSMRVHRVLTGSWS